MADKLKMSQKKFMLILIPILAILLGTVIAVTAVMNWAKVTMDSFFGKGQQHIIDLEGTEDWDADYYGAADYDSTTETKAAAAEAALKIGNEGIILMKNNGVLPLSSNDKVTALGRNVIDPVYGGSGSGNVDTSQEYIVTPMEALTSAFGNNLNTTVTDRIAEVFNANNNTGGGWTPVVRGKYGRGVIVMDDPANSFYSIGEIPWSEYAPVESTIDPDSTALVFISRPGGEGGDLTRDMSVNDSGGSADEHQLQLNSVEKELIEKAKEKCKNVVIILNMSTTMEVGALAEDEGIDAILWVGSPGAVGFSAMGNVLTGKVVPSGRTVDTWAADFTKDPTYGNFGDATYTNVDAYEPTVQYNNRIMNKFVEYEEGIYVGYRYYETAAHINGEEWYDAWKDSSDKAGDTGVVYPFGYGLSYTTFDQKITGHRVNDGRIEVDVTVTNTGDTYTGKDVVQLYYTPPYSASDNIEKAYVNLVAFAKTEPIAPHGSDEVTLSFAIEDMASYDYKTEKAYVLGSGEYEIKLMKNAHEMFDGQSFVYNNDVEKVYDESSPRESEKAAQSYMNSDGTLTDYPARRLSDANAQYIAATNRFDDVSAYMDASGMTNLSRSDWNNTFPTAMEDKAAPDNVVSKLGAFDYETDAELGNVEGSKVYQETAPTTGAEKVFDLIDLRGKNYYDREWDQFLDQLTFSDEEVSIMLSGAYNTGEAVSIGKPATSDHDGPMGWSVLFGTQPDACAWCSEVMLAATWNVDLAYEMGETVGREALALGYNGWYAPAMNIHRSPFAGRNFEYYSEDPFISGAMGTAVVSGAGKSGTYCFIKHFALNDMETNRLGVAVWANEQAIREIYLKPFEMTVKNATATIRYISDEKGNISSSTMRAATAVMSSFNRIGATQSSHNYALLTDVLRNEWGFTGMVITDFGGGSSVDAKLRAGNDLELQMGQTTDVIQDKDSATAKWAMRRAIKNICYTVVNSNAMTGIKPGSIIYYDMSGWAIGLMIGNIVIYALILAGIVWIVLRLIDSKKHPEKYKS